MEEQRQLAREADFKSGLAASIDAEASRAAQVAGAPLLCIGLVLRDLTGELCWINRAHPGFSEAVHRFGEGATVGVLGVTEERSLYVNMHAGQDEREAAVTECFADLLCSDPPTKSTLCVARLSRRVMEKRLAAGNITDSRVRAEFTRVPEYIEAFYCRVTGDGSVSFNWDEPTAPPSLTN